MARPVVFICPRWFAGAVRMRADWPPPPVDDPAANNAPFDWPTLFARWFSVAKTLRTDNLSIAKGT